MSVLLRAGRQTGSLRTWRTRHRLSTEAVNSKRSPSPRTQEQLKLRDMGTSQESEVGHMLARGQSTGQTWNTDWEKPSSRREHCAAVGYTTASDASILHQCASLNHGYSASHPASCPVYLGGQQRIAKSLGPVSSWETRMGCLARGFGLNL